MKNAMRNRIEASTRFIHSLKDEGMINADIYYISSETNHNNQTRIMAWQDITSGQITEHRGSGPHADMLNEPHVTNNVRTYQNVLDSIWN